jgi:hypothetical protein
MGNEGTRLGLNGGGTLKDSRGNNLITSSEALALHVIPGEGPVSTSCSAWSCHRRGCRAFARHDGKGPSKNK